MKRKGKIMIFLISRTSGGYDEKPCQEAKKQPFEYWHTRTCTEKEFNRKFADREGLWRAKGKNHKTTKQGYITRQEEDQERWSIEIKSLEDLISFIEKYGGLVVQKTNINENDYELEIYDDYRE